MSKFRTKTSKPTNKVKNMTIGTAVFTIVSQLIFKFFDPDESLGIAIATIINALATAFLNYWIGYLSSPKKRDGVEEVMS